jgi:uncharacterized protein YdeI (YjbR/CyaY-like superfamily)
MATRDPRIDAYIERAADFAKPILTYLRETVHAAVPEVEETLKWGHPSFTHRGILAGMAAFKGHCAFSLWKGSLIVKADPAAERAMGQFGRIRSVADLPPKQALLGYLQRAAALNAEGVTPRRPKRAPKPPAAVPADLRDALAMKKHAKARATFDGFSPSARRDYVEWITEAKTDDTRARRLATALEWMAEGKPRNWKYMKEWR